MIKLVIRYLIVFCTIALLAVGAVCYVLYQYSKELPQPSDVLNYKFDTASEVYDCNGKLIHMFAFEHRKMIEISDVPPHFIEILLQIEDSKFKTHWGVDWIGIMRATYVNLRRMRSSQGASTISQQLARNMFLSTEKRYSRKIKEIMLAVMIERQFTKQEILEAYINKVLFGNGYYGLETASMNYFRKSSSELTVAESALLVGLLRGSGYYNPIRNPERALNRRNLVLDIAFANNIITKDQYEEARNQPLEVHRTSVGSTRESDYFVEHIRPYLERKYGTNQLFTGGLKIYTTIDYDMQQYADSVMNAVLTNFEKSRDYPQKYEDVPLNAVNITTNYIQGGVFAIDPHTGYVKVMIGGRNYQHSKFNRMMQARRQPGSAFKPFVYAPALDNGFTAATIVTDEPLVFMKDDEIYWQPKNYTEDFRGYMRIREAVQRSTNIVCAKVIYDIGPRKVVEFTRQFGWSTRILPIYSLSVGSCEMIPSELITAYSIFPGRGNLVSPVYITKVTDSRGRILEEAVISKKPVLDTKTAYIMTDMLKSVINEGTAYEVRRRNFMMPAGGKTGTTDDYRDAWFIGFTKDMVLGTWVGFDDNRTLGPSMTGGVAGLPIWIPIMKYYEERLLEQGLSTTDDFEMPQGIVRVPVSRETGLLPADSYEPAITEVFVEYTQPIYYSDWYLYNYYENTHFITDEDHIIYMK